MSSAWGPKVQIQKTRGRIPSGINLVQASKHHEEIKAAFEDGREGVKQIDCVVRKASQRR